MEWSTTNAFQQYTERFTRSSYSLFVLAVVELRESVVEKKFVAFKELQQDFVSDQNLVHKIFSFTL